MNDLLGMERFEGMPDGVPPGDAGCGGRCQSIPRFDERRGKGSTQNRGQASGSAFGETSEAPGEYE
jgi:hypothetical protein